MTFSNPLFFLLFLPACLLGYWAIARLGRRWMVGYLALASLYFYSEWSRRYLLVLLGSIAMNFLISGRIVAARERARQQTAWLTFGIVANLATLCYFKYLFPLLGYLHGYGLTREWGTTILPLGISFFTFTQIAYLIDLKQGIAERETVGSYALFVTFFPHLIAGPILHHKEMMPQFRQERSYRLQPDDMALGLTWFTMGFAKKTLIADRIAPFADVVFAAPHDAGFAQAWIGVLMYAMQLYFDFSGYSDMAIGLARMFSIRFPMNFDSPYKAASIIEFWQRWHMTLTRYIMDYLYAPLQMKVSRWRLDHGRKVSRKAQATMEGALQMIVLPTMITMFIAGIWHGAGFQFLIFGLMHGSYIACNHLWRIFVPEKFVGRRILHGPVAVGVTFVAVVVSQVMFRSADVKRAASLYAGMLGRHGLGSAAGNAGLVLLLAGLGAVVWLLPNTQEILGEAQKQDDPNWSLVRGLRWRPTLGWWVAVSAVFALCMAYCSELSTFLYFQF